MSCTTLFRTILDKLWQSAQDSERDYWMKADEAKEYGMIDEVLRRG
jgi:ATP-dependent protease ClpP protease subunit